MTIYNLYIFDKEGKCLFYDEWFRTKKSGLPPDQEFKLVFGMMISLKSFAERLSTNEATQAINYYKTSTYKMTFLESATGIKILVNSDPNAIGMSDLLNKIYQIWVEVSHCPLQFLSLDESPDGSYLKSKVKDVVMRNSSYV